MLIRKLGRTGLRVSALCLGGNTFGWTTDQQASEAVLDTYVEAAARTRLLNWHDAIKPQAERYARVYVSALVDEIATSVQEHAAIVEAIGAGDADRAQRAVQTNWRNAAVRLSRVIDSVGERGSW